ncbi:SDR family oxidoreductase [Craterilacuibacter sp. RT1T]|uniref:SDR family oxidoreductase n=1 Tax=Craterilacuibacter sp. RT1T TaxID=2942211 RepID=UPI0020BF5A82|nr:SDR family oxidoreductase [Craterilacuibacter sp. RT1T]MCL6262639.1 SDR family oxidoreductase [Craterilacuibacter sp. RT1T]
MKTILISGCSSGIGYAVAHGLKSRGWRVFATCRQAGDVARLAGEGLEVLHMDVDDSASIHACVAEVLARSGGKLDALFNNAGYGQPGACEDVRRFAMRAQFETNLFGAWELMNAVLPAMRAQGYGRILYNSSVLGFAAMKYRGAYNASKYAMEGLCDTLRLELSGSNIHVSLIEPGPIVSRFRPNALAKFLENIDIEASCHRAAYEAQLARLQKPGPAAPFTLPESAVLDAVLKALEAKRPAARYRVTVPTHLFWFLKRILPTRALDALLGRAA